MPTALGERLLGAAGWDPYLEDPATHWLLHWLFLAPGSRLPVWWIAFSEGTAIEFTEEQLLERVTDELDASGAWAGPHPSSVAKDVSCLLRTYAPRARGSRDRLEDLLDRPFRELGLIRVSDADTTRFRFTVGAKHSLPAEIVAYASLDFLARTEPAARTAMVARLFSEPGSPGPIFKLSEQALVDALESVARKTGLFDVSAVAGAPQLVLGSDPAVLATALIGSYYGSPSSELVAGAWAERPSPLVIEQLPDFREPPAELDGLLQELGEANDCWAGAVAVHERQHVARSLISFRSSRASRAQLTSRATSTPRRLTGTSRPDGLSRSSLGSHARCARPRLGVRSRSPARTGRASLPRPCSSAPSAARATTKHEPRHSRHLRKLVETPLEGLERGREELGAQKTGFVRAVVTAEPEPVVQTVLRALDTGLERWISENRKESRSGCRPAPQEPSKRAREGNKQRDRSHPRAASQRRRARAGPC